MLKLLVTGNNWQERNSLKTEKLKELFYPVLPDFRKKTLFSDGSQDSNIGPSGKSNT